MVKIAFNWFEPPILECPYEIILSLGNDDPLLVKHQHVHTQPFATSVHRVTVWHIGFGASQYVPAALFENLGYVFDTFGVDQELARCQRVKRPNRISNTPL